MNPRAERVAKLFEVPVIVAALLVIPVIVIEESEPTGTLRTIVTVVNWAIWLVFAAELVVMVALVPDRWGWLRAHPLEVLVVVLTPPFLPPSLQAAGLFRLLRLLRLVLTARLLRGFFSLTGVRYASVTAVFGVLGGGAAFATVERAQDLSAWDGLYWAITTVTTVGYGDINPETDAGRIIAVIVMLVGVAYTAILTAALANAFFARVAEAEESVEDEMLARLRSIDERLERLERERGTAV